MAQQNFAIERGLRIFTEDSDTSFVDLIHATGVPGGDTGKEDAAGIGSIYFRQDTGDFYRKIANAGAPADWERMSGDQADDMFLSVGYDGVTNGTPAISDSVDVGIGKLDANQRDLTTLSGVAQGSVDLGTFTGGTIQDNRNTKQALQDLESGLEAVSGGNRDQSLGITAATRVSAVLVDDYISSEWEIVVEDAAVNSNRKVFKITAVHDGTTGADATDVDFNSSGILKIGSNFNVSLDVTLSGTGATQDMALEVTSKEPSGVNVYVRRTDLP